MSAEPKTTPRALATVSPIRTMAVAEQDVQPMVLRLRAKFPEDARGEAAIEVARIALAYGLDPFLEELIPYQGKPYVTQRGMIRIADQSPMYEGFEVEPATPDERAAFRASDKEVILKCLVYRTDRRRAIVAYGRAGYQGDRNPLSNTQAPEMAYKRAIHRALRAAFPVPMPDAPEDFASTEQVGLIHVIDRELHVTDDQRRSALQDTFGVDHSNQLTPEQASVYIDGRVLDSRELGRSTGVTSQSSTTIDVETGEIFDEAPRQAMVDAHWHDNKLVGFVATDDLATDMSTLIRLVRTAPNIDCLNHAIAAARKVKLFSDPDIKAEIEDRRSELVASAGGR